MNLQSCTGGKLHSVWLLFSQLERAAKPQLSSAYDIHTHFTKGEILKDQGLGEAQRGLGKGWEAPWLAWVSRLSTQNIPFPCSPGKLSTSPSWLRIRPLPVREGSVNPDARRFVRHTGLDPNERKRQPRNPIPFPPHWEPPAPLSWAADALPTPRPRAQSPCKRQD